MNITRLSLQHKAAVAVFVGLLCLFGYNSIQKLPVQLLPDTSSPQITIFNNWRAAAPQELEEAIIQPQEEQLRFNSGLESMISNTSRGQGRLVLNYQLGYDMKQALLDVINRLNQTKALPVDAGEPFVVSGGSGGLLSAASILVYTAEGNATTDMVVYQDLIEEVVAPRLARIPGVARVNLNDRRPKEISIIVNPFKIAVLGLQVTDITNALSRARDVSGGFADVGRRRYTVRFLGEQEISQLGELVVRLLDPTSLEVEITIPVSYLNRIDKGRMIEVNIQDLKFETPLRSMVQAGNRLSQTFQILANVPRELAHLIVTGQFADAMVAISEDRTSLFVPRDAIVLRSEGSFVFVIGDDNKAKRIDVVLGEGQGALVSVTGKLQNGDRVAVRGVERLEDGQEVITQS